MKMTDDLNDTSIALKRGRAADYVRQTLREIHISKPMLDLIDRMATAPGLPKEIDGAWLRKKWQSEVLCVNNGIINLQGLSPDIAFQNWSIDKLDNPRGLLRKSIQKAHKKFVMITYLISSSADGIRKMHAQNVCVEVKMTK